MSKSRPVSTVARAGRWSPKASTQASLYASKFARSVRNTVAVTTFERSPPASSHTRRTRSSVTLVCSRMSPAPASSPWSSTGPCPAMKSRLPARTPCENGRVEGPNDAGSRNWRSGMGWLLRWDSARSGADGRLGSGDTGDGHAVGAARHVVDAGVVEEVDRVGVAPVLAADAERDVGLGLAAQPGAHAQHLPHARGVDRLERRAVEDLQVDVAGEDLALDVVAAEAQRGLREVVGAEGEEVGLLGDPVGQEACTRQLDHRPDRVVGGVLHALLVGDALDVVAHEVELALVVDERDHDLEVGHRAGAIAHRLGRKHHRPDLHLVDLRIEEPEAHAARAEHRVDLLQRPSAVLL